MKHKLHSPDSHKIVELIKQQDSSTEERQPTTASIISNNDKKKKVRVGSATYKQKGTKGETVKKVKKEKQVEEVKI